MCCEWSFRFFIRDCCHLQTTETKQIRMKNQFFKNKTKLKHNKPAILLQQISQVDHFRTRTKQNKLNNSINNSVHFIPNNCMARIFKENSIENSKKINTFNSILLNLQLLCKSISESSQRRDSQLLRRVFPSSNHESRASDS